MTDFTFINPGELRDAELELRTLKLCEAEPEKQWVYGCIMGMYVHDKLVGQINLRLQEAYALQRFAGHVGYEVDPEHRGKRYAERACRLLWPLMRAYGFTEVVITCLPDNAASARTIENLGGVFTGLEEVAPDHEMYQKNPSPRKRYVVRL
ncbi:MAG: GNAT family N-acetyltransferase [Pseudomonadota bacterium]